MRSSAPADSFTVSDEVRTFPSYHFRTIQYVTCDIDTYNMLLSYYMGHIIWPYTYGPYVTTIIKVLRVRKKVTDSVV